MLFELGVLGLVLVGLGLIFGLIRRDQALRAIMVVIIISVALCFFSTMLTRMFGEDFPIVPLAISSILAYLYSERHRLRRLKTRPPLGSLERQRLDVDQSGPFTLPAADRSETEET